MEKVQMVPKKRYRLSGKGLRKVKKVVNSQRLIYSVCLAMMIPYIPFTQEVTAGALWLGFPYKFYTIYTLNDFSIHFGIGTFLLDVFIVYVIYTLVSILIDKVKNNRR